MKKEDIIIKWLNNDQLTQLESETFKELDVSESYLKIAQTAKKFKAPSYNSKENINTLKSKINTRSPYKFSRYTKILLKIASIFVVGIGIYFSFFKEYNTNISTLATEKTKVKLPDNSIVKLNSVSSISYNKKNWSIDRKINLEGEAFFNVAKGKTFEVHTQSAIINVIGTIFNVKQRDDYLEVTCYEGVVSVSINNDQIKVLRVGDQIKISNNEVIEKKKILIDNPEWFSDRSLFFATPYEQVLQELSWQYGVTISTKNIDKTILFTGNFVHSNINYALQSITIPMKVKYKIKNKKITIYKE